MRTCTFPRPRRRRYSQSYDQVRCLVMQGGQGEVKHWAFNDPPRRNGASTAEPPSPAEYRQLGTRIVELHPMTIIQNARTSGGGVVSNVPTQAISVGPVETWKAQKRIDLACRQPRQPLRPAADDVDDFPADSRQCGADVAIGRSSERAVQFLSRRNRQLRRRDALRGVSNGNREEKGIWGQEGIRGMTNEEIGG